jgi:hypothetical protein
MTDNKTELILSELPDYAKWYHREKTDFITYACINITPDLAITVTKLFWPDFILYEDGVFLQNRFRIATHSDWKNQLGADTSAIEKVMNHIHIAQDLLLHPFQDLSYQNIAYFGSVLINTWGAALRINYPDRTFQITGEKDGDFDDFVITFWQDIP